jgi:hypothetical protein
VNNREELPVVKSLAAFARLADKGVLKIVYDGRKWFTSAKKRRYERRYGIRHNVMMFSSQRHRASLYMCFHQYEGTIYKVSARHMPHDVILNKRVMLKSILQIEKLDLTAILLSLPNKVENTNQQPILDLLKECKINLSKEKLLPILLKIYATRDDGFELGEFKKLTKILDLYGCFDDAQPELSAIYASAYPGMKHLGSETLEELEVQCKFLSDKIEAYKAQHKII